MSDIDLSVDDRWLYVSCWGTGELKQYDVADPHNPRRRARCASAASSIALRILQTQALRLASGPGWWR